MRYREERERLKTVTQLNALASGALDAHQWDEAERLFHESLALIPEQPGTWFNLGLIYKFRRQWEQSFACNYRAFQMNDDDKAICWNLGTAATALGRWDIARQSWQKFGVPIPEGDGPIFMPLGPMPVRLKYDGHGEVVWSECIDPVRGILKNVPLPESGYGFGDTVLRDGEPTGQRFVNGRPVPVFDVLALLEPSIYNTYVIKAKLPNRLMIERLKAMCSEQETFSMEDWTESTLAVHPDHAFGSVNTETPAERPWHLDRLIGIAAMSLPDVEHLIRRWVSETGKVTVEEITCALIRS